MAERKTRGEALALLHEFTLTDALRKHGVAVETAMKAYARYYGVTDEVEIEKWGIVGLLHDFDYEMYPNPPDHPEKGAVILKAHGYPDDVIYAIRSHAEYTGCPRNSLMDKTLFACAIFARISSR